MITCYCFTTNQKTGWSLANVSQQIRKLSWREIPNKDAFLGGAFKCAMKEIIIADFFFFYKLIWLVTGFAFFLQS